jgi:hypothetical protein
VSNNEPSPDAQDLDDFLDYATLSELRGDEDGDGPLDHPCPLCGPDRRSEYNQTRPVLRTWKPGPGFITYCCKPFVVTRNGQFLFIVHCYSARQARELVAARLADTTGVFIVAPKGAENSDL